MHPFMLKYNSKYRAKKAVVDGQTFDSRGEMRRFHALQLMERAGEITDLQRQVPYQLIVNGMLVCTYRADFTYRENGALVVEDFKSPVSRKLKDYVIKKKLMKACHNIEIRETQR